MSYWIKVSSTFFINKSRHSNLNKDNILAEFEKVLNYEDIWPLEDAGTFYNNEFNKDKEYLPYGDEGSLIPTVGETSKHIIVMINGSLRDSHFSIGEILDWYTNKIHKLGCTGTINIDDGYNNIKTTTGDLWRI